MAPAVLAQDATPTWDPASFGSAFTLELYASGFEDPVGVVDPNDGSERLFVIEQGGKVRVLTGGAPLETPMLDLSDKVSTSSEQGLLGLALHPDFAVNGEVFVNYTDVEGNSVVARFRISDDEPNQIDPNSAETILTLDQPFPNHNGGHLVFGPDGFLYIGFGDGGSSGDPEGNGQNPFTWLGSILRIDIDRTSDDRAYAIPADNPFADGSAGAPEVFIYGLRNPWRFAFDPANGDLFIADVGQNAIEEVTWLPSGQQAGANLGWDRFEGSTCFDTADCDATGTILPAFEYDHGFGCSVTGGVVVRNSIPALEGVYLFADFCSGLLWGIGRDANENWSASDPVETGLNVSSFGTTAAGDVLVIHHRGDIYRLVAP